MAILLRLRNRPKIGPLTLDCTINEGHNLENEITDSPVELGATVTDHVRNLPRVLVLEGIVSDTPDTLTLGALLGSIAGATGSVIASQSGAVGSQVATGVAGAAAVGLGVGLSAFFGSATRSKDAWRTLRLLWRLRERFNVTTTLETYRNMVVQSVSVPRSAGQSNALFFTATLRKIEFASTSLAVNLALDVADLAGGPQNLGIQPTVSFEDL